MLARVCLRLRSLASDFRISNWRFLFRSSARRRPVPADDAARPLALSLSLICLSRDEQTNAREAFTAAALFTRLTHNNREQVNGWPHPAQTRQCFYLEPVSLSGATPSSLHLRPESAETTKNEALKWSHFIFISAELSAASHSPLRRWHAQLPPCEPPVSSAADKYFTTRGNSNG